MVEITAQDKVGNKKLAVERWRESEVFEISIQRALKRQVQPTIRRPKQKNGDKESVLDCGYRIIEEVVQLTLNGKWHHDFFVAVLKM